MNRLGLIPPEELTSEQRPLYDIIDEYASRTRFTTKYPTGELVGAFALLLQNPSFGELWFRLDRGVGSLSGLTPKMREVAILVVAARTQCDYEIYAHQVMAEAVGLTQDQRDDLMNGKCSESLGPDEKVVWEVANALGKPGPLDEDIWKRGVEGIGRESMTSTIHVVGFYQYVSTILNGFDVKVPHANQTG